MAVAPPRERAPVAGALATPSPHAEPTPWPRRFTWAAAAAAVLAIGLMWLTPGFRDRWVVDVTGWFDAFRDWAIENRTTSWLFVYLITPIEDGITVAFDATVNTLERTTWLGVRAFPSGLAGDP